MVRYWCSEAGLTHGGEECGGGTRLDGKLSGTELDPRPQPFSAAAQARPPSSAAARSGFRLG